MSLCADAHTYACACTRTVYNVYKVYVYTPEPAGSLERRSGQMPVAMLEDPPPGFPLSACLLPSANDVSLTQGWEMALFEPSSARFLLFLTLTLLTLNITDLGPFVKNCDYWPFKELCSLALPLISRPATSERTRPRGGEGRTTLGIGWGGN